MVPQNLLHDDLFERVQLEFGQCLYSFYGGRLTLCVNICLITEIKLGPAKS